MNENARPVIMNRSSASGHFACRIEAPLIPRNGDIMRIHVGCELSFDFPQTVPMIATLNVHFSRFSDLERPDHLVTKPSVPVEGYRDSFGDWCSRLVAPAGRFTLGTDAIVRDPGVSDPVDLNALQHQVQHLPTECCSCLAAATVRPIAFPMTLGASSDIRRSAGRGCKPSATSYTTTSPSATSTPAPPEPRPKHTQSATAFVATT